MARSRSAAWTLGLILPALAIGRPYDPPQPPAPTAFTSEVLTNFAAWDRDSDGVLEPAELDKLVIDHALVGKPAAAAGVLKAAQRSTKTVLPPVTLDYLHEYERNVAEKKKVSPNFDRSFTRAVKRLSTGPRDLLRGERPTLDSCHQGPLGDCYFVSVVGAAVARDPVSVLALIGSAADGSYVVTFGDGKSATVEPLTDVEIALTSTTGENGMWLPILEKAYGKIRTDTLPEEKQSESTTDAIARGGSPATTIRLITGHATDRIGLRPRAPTTKPPAQPAGDAKPAKATAPPEIDPEVLSRHLASTLPKVREHLARSLADRRLVAAGTPKEGKMPPGVNANHAYAVLGFDATKDTIALWNPHGNTFTPKGEPGLEHGYPTRAGRFEMPLEDFGRVFNGISFETDRPLETKN